MGQNITISLVALAVFTAGLLGAELKQSRRAQIIFKPLAGLAFIALAIFCGALENAYGQLILLALVLSFIGDNLLLRKGTGPAFIGGLFAFLLAHIVYAIAFFRGGSLAFYALLAALAILSALAMGPLYKSHVDKATLAATRLYGAIITIMVALAIRLGMDTGIWIIAVAAIMFAVSDVFVGRDRYIQQSPKNFLAITPLYFGAQAVFALSILWPL
ncbi:MAG: lysoplasmalogenase [Robiginitomaculum sp.]